MWVLRRGRKYPWGVSKDSTTIAKVTLRLVIFLGAPGCAPPERMERGERCPTQSAVDVFQRVTFLVPVQHHLPQTPARPENGATPPEPLLTATAWPVRRANGAMQPVRQMPVIVLIVPQVVIRLLAEVNIP